MEEKSKQRGNRLDLKLELTNSMVGSNEYNKIIESSEYVISGLVTFRVKMVILKNQNDFVVLVNIRLVKILQSDKLTYATTLCSNKNITIQKITLSTSDTSWCQIYEYNQNRANSSSLNFSILLNVVLNLHNSCSRLAYLHNDTDLTDFELRSKDGSVHVHKNILAAHSPVLKSLVAGDWREAKEGSVNVEGTTKEILEHLKDYMYNDKLPENGLKELMILASYYMMEDLVQKCSFKLLTGLSTENSLELAAFAVEYGATNLFIAIIKNAQKGIINVEDMEKLVLVGKSVNDKKNEEEN